MTPALTESSQISLTKAQINRAGRRLRRWLEGEPTDPQKVDRAFAIVQAYRAAHQYPLLKANMGLRRAVQAEKARVEVSQRLKRMTTILDKLRREPTMGLAEMQDVGGCRAVLDSIPEVRRVEKRLMSTREVDGYKDYIGTPRPTGYRGVHVILVYSDRRGDPYSIEIQLRTRVMHEWAITVERLSGRLQEDLKSASGPKQVLDLMSAISEAMAIEERLEAVPETLQEHIRNLRLDALPYIGGKP